MDDQIRENNQNSDANKELESCKNEVQVLKDSFLRLSADFENYKKRITKEKSEWLISAQNDIILDILNIVDDFDRAFTELHKKEISKEFQNWISGFELIHKSLYKLLNKYNVKEIQDNNIFNPEIHEAIAQVESADKKSGQIVNVAQKGFTFNNRVLRPAKVVVAK